MCGVRAAPTLPSAVTVLAICISAKMPSCMRAPPEALTVISGARRLTERSAARAIFSPTTLPMLAPMNAKSSATTSTGRASIVAEPAMAASRSPVFEAASTSLRP